MATLADYAAVYELIIDVVSEGVQATVNATVRQTIEAVKALLAEATDKEGASVSVTQLAERLDLDKSAASRRVRVAEGLGYLVNLEDRKGKPSRLVLGDPLPEEKPVLPSPEGLAGGEGGSYPQNNTATVQHSPNGRPTTTIRGVLVDYDAYADRLWEGFSVEEAVERARIGHAEA